ncbi:Biogenesis of lysosome-related organelles complex 1 subunit 6 [Liparis tanakae]|uniref:Biogenesis of lysosome-related organelles complex 1 subunit 6 n=1 Tax=Liparis tanakae TaxID=230148 RepID=A0A4Z2E605_9TELE|nr:Biogenesis of lysosome-related organelles complex 1 subunit 6 [Liparis tanakae]
MSEPWGALGLRMSEPWGGSHRDYFLTTYRISRTASEPSRSSQRMSIREERGGSSQVTLTRVCVVWTRQNQLVLLDTLDQEVTKFRDCNALLDLNSLFTEAKVYHNKLVTIRKEMIVLHERTTKLKRRGLKLQQQKQKEALEKEQRREKELERERQLSSERPRATRRPPSDPQSFVQHISEKRFRKRGGSRDQRADVTDERSTRKRSDVPVLGPDFTLITWGQASKRVIQIPQSSASDPPDLSRYFKTLPD